MLIYSPLDLPEGPGGVILFNQKGTQMRRLYDMGIVVVGIIMLAIVLIIMLGCDSIYLHKDNCEVLVFTANWCKQCQIDKPKIAILKNVRIIDIDQYSFEPKV